MSETFILTLVLLSAFFSAIHALLLKSSPDRDWTFFISNSCYLLLGCIFVWFVSIPESAAWPYLIASSIFTTLQIAMSKLALNRGELTVVWPVGSSVKFISLVLLASMLFSEPLTILTVIALLTIVTGIWFVDLASLGTSTRSAIIYSALFGFFLAIQLLLAAQGIKLVSNPVNYIIWDYFTVIPSILITGFFSKIQWKNFQPHLKHGLFVGISDIISYSIMLYLFFSSYVGQIVIWKQSSLLMVLLLSALFLGERITKIKVLAFILITIGLVLGNY